jgi:hypothetical protein
MSRNFPYASWTQTTHNVSSILRIHTIEDSTCIGSKYKPAITCQLLRLQTLAISKRTECPHTQNCPLSNKAQESSHCALETNLREVSETGGLRPKGVTPTPSRILPNPKEFAFSYSTRSSKLLKISPYLCFQST